MARTKQTDKKKKLAEFIETELEKSQDMRHKIQRQWFINKIFILGYQWFEYNETLERLERVKKSAHRRRPVYNKLLQLYNTLVSNLLDNNLDVGVMADPDDADNQKKAFATEKVAKGIMYENKFEDVMLEEIVGEMLLTGIGMAAPIWNPEKGGKKTVSYYDEVGVDDEGAGILADEETEENISIGQVEFVPYFSQEIVFPPDARRFEDVLNNYYMVIKERDPEKVKEEYGLSETPKFNDNPEDKSVMRKIMQFVNKKQGLDAEENALDKLCIVVELWRAPCKEYKNGQFATYVNGLIVQESELPDWTENEEGEKELMLCFFPCYNVSGRLYPMSAYETLIDWQKNFNKMWGGIDESQSMAAGGKVIKYDKSLVGNQKITKEPMQILTVKKGATPPQWIAPRSVATDTIAILDRLAKMPDEISNTRTISTGGVPSGVTSGRAIESLSEIDQKDMNILERHISSGVKELVRKSLNIARIMYKEPRIIKYAGVDSFETYDIKDGSEIGTSFEVKVNFGGGLPKSKYAKLNFLLSMKKEGVFTDEPDAKAFREAIGFLNLPDIFNKDEALDENEAKRHLEALKGGEPQYAQVFETQNHEYHMYYEGQFTKTEEFEEILFNEPEKAQTFFAHINEHKGYLMAFGPGVQQNPNNIVPMQDKQGGSAKPVPAVNPQPATPLAPRTQQGGGI